MAILTKCSISSCAKPLNRKGLCTMHYARLKRHGDPLFTKRASQQQGLVCSIAGCPAPRQWKGLCKSHYMKKWRVAAKTTRPIFAIRCPNCNHTISHLEMKIVRSRIRKSILSILPKNKAITAQDLLSALPNTISKMQINRGLRYLAGIGAVTRLEHGKYILPNRKPDDR